MTTYLLDTGWVLRHLRSQQPEERYVTQKLLTRLTTIDLDRETADRAGDMIAASRRAGHVLSVPDAIIAATAIGHGLTLVTLNIGDFEQLPGLSLYPLER